MKKQFIIEVYEYGILLCSPPDSAGIPINALGRARGMLPEGSVIAIGVANFYNYASRQNTAVMAIANSKAAASLWGAVIEQQLQSISDPEIRWQSGIHVGASSQCIFNVLRKNPRPDPVASVPHDSGDFERCRKLIELMPGWRARLGEVAAQYPKSKWPAIIERWDALAAATPEQCYKVLQSL